MEDTWPSKTDVCCDCNSLNEAANNPDVPIEFDATVNEFHIIYTVPDSYMLIRHCPFCGGKAPTSKRDSLFAEIPFEELSRLARLTGSLKRVGDVIATFGAPDRDQEVGEMLTRRPEGEDMPPETQVYRVLVYRELSGVADMRVTVFYDERVSITFAGKYIGGEPA